MSRQRRKVRRKRRSKRGDHVSTKMGRTFSYRSGWERALMEHLDVDHTVLSWSYECVSIEYIANRSGRVRKYIPDFLIERSDGSRVIIEVKPARKTKSALNLKKFAAAQSWCDSHEMTFVVFTEIELKSLGLLRR